jgi:hypothetical protein
MNAESQPRTAPSINGHMIALGVGHSIAIHERNGEGFVAEFRDGLGELSHAGSWFRFNAGALQSLRGRAALRCYTPLTAKMLQNIERLHAEREAREERMRAVPRTVAAAARRYCINVMSPARPCSQGKPDVRLRRCSECPEIHLPSRLI